MAYLTVLLLKTNNGAAVLSSGLACQQWLSDSSPFQVAKLSLYSACSSGDGGGGEMEIAFDRWGEYVFFWHLPSPSHLNQLFCNLHDLWIEFSGCLERRLLKRRTAVALSDLASRTYARVELEFKLQQTSHHSCAYLRINRFDELNLNYNWRLP